VMRSPTPLTPIALDCVNPRDDRTAQQGDI
jgi:hypothetical protein